jgi:hypothetical protein
MLLRERFGAAAALGARGAAAASDSAAATVTTRRAPLNAWALRFVTRLRSNNLPKLMNNPIADRLLDRIQQPGHHRTLQQSWGPQHWLCR